MRDHEDIAIRIVSRIMWDIADRRGLNQEWGKIDDETKKEIIQAWRGLVIDALNEKEP